MEHKIDGVGSVTVDATTIPARMSIGEESSCSRLLLTVTQVPKVMISFMPLDAFLAKH